MRANVRLQYEPQPQYTVLKKKTRSIYFNYVYRFSYITRIVQPFFIIVVKKYIDLFTIPNLKRTQIICIIR